MEMEIEIKYKLTSAEVFTQKLLADGYKELKQYHEIDSYYMVNKLAPVSDSTYYRIRHDLVSGTHMCELKYKTENIAVNHEDEVAVSKEQAAQFHIIYRKIFGEPCVVNKKRITYVHPNHKEVKIVVDQVEGLGPYTEIEIVDDNLEPNADALLYEIANDLGLIQQDLIPVNIGYSDLILGKA